jgi:hypothetical protein
VEARAGLEQAEEVSQALGARGISYRVQSPNTGRCPPRRITPDLDKDAGSFEGPRIGLNTDRVPY